MELQKMMSDWSTVEVYDHYDKPLIYTSKQKNDDTLFMNYFVDDDMSGEDNFSTYMVFPISEETVNKMNDGTLSLRQMLLSSENMHLFHWHFGRDEIRFEQVVPSELPEDYIPDEGVFLN
jgi:hypothetical protein